MKWITLILALLYCLPVTSQQVTSNVIVEYNTMDFSLPGSFRSPWRYSRVDGTLYRWDYLASAWVSFNSGASDGVAQSGTLDAVNEEIDVSVASPGTSFSIDLAAIETLPSFSGWDTNVSDDFAGLYTGLDFTGTTGLADGIDNTRTDEEIQDVAGDMVTGNTETLITVTYDDAGAKLNYVVENDLSQYSNATSGFLTSEVDGSTTNEGQLSVGAGAANTAQIVSNTLGSETITFSGGTGITVTEDTGTNVITITSSTGTGSDQAITRVVTREFTGDGTFDLYLDGISEELVMPNNSIWVGYYSCSMIATTAGGDVEVGDEFVRTGSIKSKNIAGAISVDNSVFYTSSDVDLSGSVISFFPDSPDNAVRVIFNPDDGGGATMVTRNVCRLDLAETTF